MRTEDEIRKKLEKIKSDLNGEFSAILIAQKCALEWVLSK